MSDYPSPAPAEIRSARQAAGLTQTQAASLVLSPLRRWQDWEAGTHRMHPGLWALFQLRTAPPPPLNGDTPSAA